MAHHTSAYSTIATYYVLQCRLASVLGILSISVYCTPNPALRMTTAQRNHLNQAYLKISGRLRWQRNCVNKLCCLARALSLFLMERIYAQISKLGQLQQAQSCAAWISYPTLVLVVDLLPTTKSCATVVFQRNNLLTLYFYHRERQRKRGVLCVCCVVWSLQA